jgi:hypothetical protein
VRVFAHSALTCESSNNCRSCCPTPPPIGPRLEVRCHRHTHVQLTYLQGGDARPNRRQAAIIATRQRRRTLPGSPVVADINCIPTIIQHTVT